MKRKVVVALIASLVIAQVGVGAVRKNQYVVSAKSTNNVSVQSVQKTLDESFFEKMVEKGIFNADKDVKEESEESVTRQEFIIALHRMSSSPLVLDKNESFADVDYAGGGELARALTWAEEEKLFDGLDEEFFQDGKFDAEKALSKQEAMKILYNYAKYKEIVSMYVNKNALISVADKDDVADWAKEAVKWAFGNKFVDTDNEQKINPEKEMTNEESAKLLSTYLDLQKRVENERTQEESSENHNDYVSVNTGNAGSTTQNNGQSQTGDAGNSNSENQSVPMTPLEPSEPVIPMTPLEPSKPVIPMTPLEPSKPHEHHWVDNIVTIKHPEEGHWEKELVKEAWDEIIHHDEEGHWEKELVKEAWDEIIHHDEEGHWEKELVKEAWDEEVPIYEEQIRSVCNNCQEDITGFEDDHMYEHLSNGELAGWHDEVRNVQVGTETIHHDAVYEDKWIVDKEAWDETVHHDAVYEDKWIVDKEAWTEEIVDGKICSDCGKIEK